MLTRRAILVAVLAVVAGSLFTRAAFAVATLALEPKETAPGAKVVATGSEFSGSTVDLYLDNVGGTLLATGPITQQAFELSFAAPASGGTHTIVACGYRTRGTCLTRAQAELIVKPPSPTTTSSTTTTPPRTTTTTTPPRTTTTTIPGSTTTTMPGSTTTTPPATTTSTTATPPAATTLPPAPVFPTGDDFTWTRENPPPPTAGGFSVPTTLPPPSVASPDSMDPEDWPDLRATAIEITQGMQNMANDMPLVAGRKTFARVYLDVIGVDSWAPISGVLEIWDGPLFVGQLTPENPGATAWADGGDRLDLDDSLYFEIPLSWADGTDVRFSALVWSFEPATLSNEPDDSNNVRHAFVDFFDAQPVTVHPAPLHLHRSYHPTDEIRTYTAVFGGGVYADGVGATSGALDVIEGLWRYHPVSSVSIEPYPSVLYPLDHASDLEWNLGGCQTTYLGEAEAIIDLPGYSNLTFDALASWEPFFEDPGSIDPVDLVADYEEWNWGLSPDRSGLAILDRRFEVTKIFIDPSTGLVGMFRLTEDSTGPEPIAGAPAFVSGCTPDDAEYGAPNEVMGLHRVWYDWDDETEYFLGMVDPSLPTRWGGLASPGSDAAWSRFTQTTGEERPWSHAGARLVGHELGHLAGLSHAPCKNSDGDGIPDELEGGPIDWEHPGVDWFPDCHLAEIDPEGFFGFDVYHALFGLSEPVVISPDPAAPPLNLGFPLMGYKPPAWTDPFHWCRLLEHYGVACNPNVVGIHWNPPPPGETDGDFTGTLPPVPSTDRDVAIITGRIFNDRGRDADDEPGLPGVTIYVDINTNVIPGCAACSLDLAAFDPPLPPPGDDAHPDVLWVEVKGGDGTLLQRSRVPFEQEHNEHHGDIEFQVPVVFQPGATIRFLDEHGETVAETTADIDAREIVSMNFRRIDLPSGQQTLDGPWDQLPHDALHILQYSADGEHWLALESRRGDPIRQIDPGIWDRVPGSSQGRTRMLVSWEWSGVVVDGPDVVVPNKAPIVSIQLPLDGASYATNEMVELAATALDPEDRDLTDQIVWSSSLTGELGVGSSVAVWTLPAGNHEITASVTDSQGLTSTMTSSIFVSDELVQAQLTEADRETIARYLDTPPETTVVPTDTTVVGAPSGPGGDTGGGIGWLPGIVVGLAGAGAVALWIRTRRHGTPGS